VELLAQGKKLDRKQREFVNIILVSTNRLTDLVNDLLDVARVETGQVEIRARPLELAEVVAEVATLIGPRLEEKRQTLAVDIAPDVPRALADPIRVRQILTNLITNAHLYTDVGGKLGIALAAHGDSVALVISDNGRGLSEDGGQA